MLGVHGESADTFSRHIGVQTHEGTQEQQQSVELTYDGKLNRSRACYVMDITMHMQMLCNYIRTLKEENKQLSDYDEEKMPRTIQLGPEAISPYTMKRTVLQGANTESSTTKAPIEIEITYTMIK